MRIGVISDTHGDIEAAETVIKERDDLDLIIHLGDHYDDGIKLKEKIGIPLIGVRGNCDSYVAGEDEMVYEAKGHKILIIHGHQYGVKSDLNRLYYRALELGCDLALYGHTHIPISITFGNVMILNPGSLCLPRGGAKPSYGVVEQGQEIRSYIMEL
ncbi:YfcE family phosphodiesterase [Anaerosolibacter sp.]|uniref:YfcE family phosphodiesterase n=1 Tax=Anaerosolibacter sp. TaxID=1872527 RepID=UPI0039F00055